MNEADLKKSLESIKALWNNPTTMLLPFVSKACRLDHFTTASFLTHTRAATHKGDRLVSSHRARLDSF
jgi:hypothetical protein